MHVTVLTFLLNNANALLPEITFLLIHYFSVLRSQYKTKSVGCVIDTSVLFTRAQMTR